MPTRPAEVSEPARSQRGILQRSVPLPPRRAETQASLPGLNAVYFATKSSQLIHERWIGDRAVVPVYVYRSDTHDEVVLRKEGERDRRYVADGNHVSPIRIVHVAPYYLIPGKTRIGPLIPAQSR